MIGNIKIVNWILIALFVVLALLPIGMLIGTALIEKADAISFDMRQLMLLLTSLKVGSGVAALSMLFGFLFAFFIEQTNVSGRKWLHIMTLCPLMIPPYIYALTLCKIFPKWEIFSGVSGVIFILSFSFFPFVYLIISAGMKSLDRRLVEAARLSHNEWGVLWKITLPLLMPYILSSGVLVFMFAICEYGVPAFLQVSVYPVEVFILFGALYDHSGAVLMALPLIVIALFLVLLLKYYMRSRAFVSIDSNYKETQLFDLRKYRVLVGIFLFLIIGAVVVMPVVVLMIEAGGVSSYVISIKRSLSVMVDSVFYSAISALVTTVVSFFIAYTIEKKKGSSILDVLSLVPFAVPATVIGIALIFFWNTAYTEFVYTSPLILIIAYVTLASPFAIRILISNFKQINRNLDEAARISGVSTLKRICCIQVPLLSKGLKCAWAISFVLCMRELGATLLVIPAGRETLSIKIYSLMHYGASKMVAALSIVILCLTLIPVMMVFFIGKKRRVEM